jgi:proline iminopeptidase
MGRLVDIADTRLFVDERGDAAGFPLLVLHGGPGLDHTMFADYLDPLTSDGRRRLVMVDQRACGLSDRSADPSTWTLERMAEDIQDLAAELGLGRDYVVLGHSFGAMAVLQHAVDHPGDLRGTIVSAGMADATWLAEVDANLASFEPLELREQVTASWAREKEVRTNEEMEQLMRDQMPFHFRDPRGAALIDYLRRTEGRAQYSPDVVRRFAAEEYGGIAVRDRLKQVTHPVLVLAGRHDRTCVSGASEEMTELLPHAELVVFEESAHMFFAEEQYRFLKAVTAFLDRVTG